VPIVIDINQQFGDPPTTIVAVTVKAARRELVLLGFALTSSDLTYLDGERLSGDHAVVALTGAPFCDEGKWEFRPGLTVTDAMKVAGVEGLLVVTDARAVSS
jgi:hypothetical protein